MAINEDFFKREEDRKWRDAVDHQLVTLLTGHQVIDRRLSELEDQMDELDSAIRGDPGNMHSGVVGRLERQEEIISRLNSVIFMDAAGSKGMLEEFKKMQRKEKRWEINRTSLTAIVLAVISTVGLLLREWPSFAKSWNKPSADKVEVKIEKAKHPKGKKVFVQHVIREKPDEPSETVPQVQDPDAR